MGIYAKLLDAFETEDDQKNRVITSGTTRVTRGTGLVAVTFVGLALVFQELSESVPLLGALSTGQMLSLVTVAGFVWAIVSAADILGRAIATARTSSPTGGKTITVTDEGAVGKGRHLVLHDVGKPHHMMAVSVKPGDNGDWSIHKLSEWDAE